MSPVSCSPDSCWELILLGHLLAKSLTLGLSSLIYKAQPERPFQDCFCLQPSIEECFHCIKKHTGLGIWPPLRLPRGSSFNSKERCTSNTLRHQFCHNSTHQYLSGSSPVPFSNTFLTLDLPTPSPLLFLLRKSLHCALESACKAKLCCFLAL